MRLFVSKENHWLEERKAFKSESGALRIQVEKGLSSFPFLGFGGAFTEASAYVYSSLSEENKKKALEACFGKEGLRYNLGRVCIGSSDFSLSSYFYSAKEGLSDFSLEHEERYLFPFLREAYSLSPEMKLLASPWSPLAKWKTNLDLEHGGRLKKEFYPSWSRYVRLYREKMKERGFPVSSLTVQNETEATQVWESCLYSPEEEASLLSCLKKENPDAEIYVHDHNRDHMVERSERIFSLNPEEASGIAFHWYDRTCFDKVKEASKRFPSKRLIFTEGCVETLTSDFNGTMGSYSSFLRYLENYLNDLNNGCTAFYDWNLLLDLRGGPNHVGNYCEALLMGEGGDLRFLPSYYAVYHLSHFIERGAETLHLVSPEPSLLCAGAINPNGEKVYVFLNKGNPLTIEIDGVAFFLGNEEGATLLL